MPASITEMNEQLFAQLETPGMEKNALDAVNEFTRVRVREDGFYRKILPAVQVANDELDRQVDTDKPVVVVDKEPGSPAAISIPFATLPINIYIRGPRYRVMFDRIVTPRSTSRATSSTRRGRLARASSGSARHRPGLVTARSCSTCSGQRGRSMIHRCEIWRLVPDGGSLKWPSAIRVAG